MKRLILALLLLPTVALAQRGGPQVPPQNVMLSCNVANPTGNYCGGYERQFCAVDTSSTDGKLWRCSVTYHTWVKIGETSGGTTPTTVAFADSLSANGANCNAGSAPLGVSATGAAEGCFSVQPLDSDLTSIATLNFCSPGQIPKSSGGTSWACSADSTGGSPTFDTVGAGTSTATHLVVGNTSVLDTSGSGSIIATGLVCASSCVDMATELGTFSSADIIGRCSDETGTGPMVFATAPTLTNPVVGTQAANDSSTKAASTAYVQTEFTAYASDTVTLTNKTYDAEGQGNVLTVPTKVWLPAAGCQASTATSFWDNLTANPAVAACVTGSNTQKGVLDFDPSTDQFAQTSIMLPSDWVGTVDAKFLWLAAATSGNVIWSIATICVADAATDDPAFNTASTVTDAAKGTTLQLNTATITGVTTTGCAAGQLMHINVSRNASNGSDTMAGNARLVGVELTMRRSI